MGRKYCQILKLLLFISTLIRNSFKYFQIYFKGSQLNKVNSHLVSQSEKITYAYCTHIAFHGGNPVVLIVLWVFHRFTLRDYWRLDWLCLFCVSQNQSSPYPPH